MQTLQDMILSLLSFWKNKNCILHQGHDLEVGAGTFNPATFLRALGKEPYNAAYVEPSRRPQDGRYGTHPNRLQNYHQLQVILKPCPKDIQTLYLLSLESIGLNLKEHDIRFVHDDWENPTIGAWGLGWEVWLNGMEITQITYFQAIGSQNLDVISGEITYGIERIAMYLQGKDSIFDIMWNQNLTYGDIVQESEKEWSYYNFQEANTDMWFTHFEDFHKEAIRLIERKLPVPAYDFIIKSSHAFNILDSRGCISATERTRYITSIRNLAKLVAEVYVEKRKLLQYPLLFSHIQEKTKMDPIFPVNFTCTKNKATLLIEIGVEELPDSFISIGNNSFQELLTTLFKDHGLSYTSLQMFSTPRRLGCLVEDLDMVTPLKTESKKGPQVSSLFSENNLISEQGKNFFKRFQITLSRKEELEAFSQFSIKKINNTEYVFIKKQLGNEPTFKILQNNFIKILSNIYFPKKMFWNASHFYFARPIRWLVAMLDDQVLPLTFFDISASNISYGHRQLTNNAKISISSAQNYVSLLKSHFVLVDPEERKQEILDNISLLETKHNFSVICKKQLLSKIVNLTEFPKVTLGSFKQEFCDLPKELLIAEMVEHQKYFPIVNQENLITNSFIIVADNRPNNTIIKGNEKALEPRLTDGDFLFKEDLKTPLSCYLNKLKNFIFFEQLGSMFDKTNRLQQHLVHIYPTLSLCPQEDIKEAIFLSKIDLVSNVVNEFPELQGIMGYYYASHLNTYSFNVLQAVKEQYTLITKNITLSPTGILLAFIDKIDNLLSCFLLNLKPTSSHDPYALRRQSIEILWLIILQIKKSFNFQQILQTCLQNFPKELTNSLHNKEDLCSEISLFVMNRFKIILVDLGYSKDIIAAVVNPLCTNFYSLKNIVHTLSLLALEKSQKLSNLIQISHRLRKLLSNQPSLDNTEDPTTPQKILDIEENILKVVQEIESSQINYENCYTEEDCLIYIDLLNKLYPLLNELFNKVKIISEDNLTKHFRLFYLNKILSLLDRFCVFDKIQILN